MIIDGCKRIARALWAHRGGGVLVYFAFGLPVFVGAVGLSVDVADWQLNRRVAQNLADSAAIAGALEKFRSGSANVEGAATDSAIRNGYKGTANESLVIHHPPATGEYAGAGDSVEVVYSRTLPTMFSQILFSDTTTVRARAVGRAHIDDTCVWALNPTKSSALKFSGGGTAAFKCGLLANSVDASAVTQSGGGCVTATNIRVVGGYTGSCFDPPPITGVKPIKDPFSVPPPDYEGCDFTGNFKANDGQTIVLQPGVYCGSISAVSTGRIEFEPGLYILDGTGMSFGGQSTATGSGVTFYLTNTTSSKTVDVQAGATVELSAPTTGPYAGVLFYQDKNAPAGITHSLTGGGTMDLDGIIYMPNQSLKFSGGSATDNSSSILIADTVDFTGQAHLGDFDGSAATANPGLVKIVLVE